jgi:tetratricopeptide (TPR) repeat protein
MSYQKNGKETLMKTSSVLQLIGVAFFLTILPAQVHALTPDQVFDKVKDSIVVVQTLDAQGKVKGQGSGVLLPSGKIATNCHVVEGGASYQVGRGKKLVSATLYAEDMDKDICLLDARAITGKHVQLGKAAGLKVGVPVYAVGAPQGLELSLSNGIVAQLRGGSPPLIQTTAAISPGSSGGGLFDKEGRLVGLTTLYIEGGQNLNFAMPVEWIGEIKPGRKIAAAGYGETEWWKRAVALIEMKDWNGLLDWSLKWTAKNSKSALAWFSLGAACCNLNRYEDAIEAFRQALRLNPQFADAWSNIGTSYTALDRYDDAIEAFRQALRVDPKNVEAWVGLGASYNWLGRKNDAIEAFRQALHINPKHVSAWLGLGATYTSLTRYEDAIEAFRHALHLNPEYAEAWFGLGVAYFFSGNRTAALEVVQKLRNINSEMADELFNKIVPR